MCVNKTFNDSTNSNSHDPQGRPPPTPFLLTLLNVIIPSKTNPFLLTSCRLANGQVGGHFCENHTYISREIPAGQLDNAWEKILMRLNSSLPTTLSLFLWFGPQQENTLYSSINVHNHGSSSKKIDHAMAQTPPFLKCYWFQFKYTDEWECLHFLASFMALKWWDQTTDQIVAPARHVLTLAWLNMKFIWKHV